jgi:beta-glucanase (GH16 family)
MLTATQAVSHRRFQPPSSRSALRQQVPPDSFLTGSSPTDPWRKARQAFQAQPPQPTQPPPQQWKLVWSDEFNTPNGSAPDANNWRFDLGGGGFGNHELEYYTSRPENVRVEDGNLVIQAHQEDYTGPDGVKAGYTSARINSAQLFSQQYGRLEARIKIPEGRGMWPAFWALGENIGETGWPTCGEIDVMENVGHEPNTVHGTVHGPGYSGENGIGAPFKLPEGQKFSDDFHLYSVEWSPEAVHFQVDNQTYHTVTRESLPAGTDWVFDHNFFLLLNVAVGGDWPGPPDAQTQFPQKMLVDYVRAYQPADSRQTK